MHSSLPSSLVCLLRLPTGRPSFTPSAFFLASPALVLEDSRSLSIWALKEKQNARIAEEISVPSLQFSLTVQTLISLDMQRFKISITINRDLPSLEISVQIIISSFCACFSRAPSFLFSGFLVPLTVSSNHWSMVILFFSQKFLISNFWLSTSCLLVETLTYAMFMF